MDKFERIINAVVLDTFAKIIKGHEKDIKRFLKDPDNYELPDDLFMNLAQHYEMPYGTMKARTGDPWTFLFDKISKEPQIKKFAVYTNQTNIDPDSSYYKVISSFPVFHIIGHKPSNAYYGNSNILQPVFKKVIAKPGDEIHNYPGGIFHIMKGVAYPFDTEEREFSAFEHKQNYYKFDLSKLEKINNPTQVKRFQRP